MNTTYKAIELSGPGKFSEELFEVAHKYEFADFQKAVQHASSPGKTGIVLLKTPV
jgi:hypothetical protein